ncbi:MULTISPECIES: GNAT family N-acetyltransferase [unclassified Streptomyces]|uniref:GNAT family N-acetyltransferase n=1 Tax=Streptomycetaceae TaxID=2062 RepID=UPI002E798252|nr:MULTISPECIES: GNAT family N-acetyltransferase [unclassified Streptomyces]MED7950974.1 GNAT family N-acetyltransferase [Streptomyces sp. BE303]MEE1825498.1 GNAT family N-acetyltransferase [Streptomyces sp. BE20]
MILRLVQDTAADAEVVQHIARAASASLPDSPGAGDRTRSPVLPLARTRHLVRTDPQGCWLAEIGGEPIGTVLSLRREGVWVLALFAVVPGAQGRGVGRLLLERAAAYGRGCLRGMLCAPPSPAAARRYRLAGFTLHPAMRLTGKVDRAGLLDPGDIPVHPGNASHRHLLDSVDRRLRGAAHGPDHELMLAHCEELLVADALAGSGYCYRDGGEIRLLAASSKRIAVRLLREALARVPDGTEARVDHLTAEQEWALDVGLELGLTLETRGYLGLRGMRPPAPYLPNGALL